MEQIPLWPPVKDPLRHMPKTIWIVLDRFGNPLFTTPSYAVARLQAESEDFMALYELVDESVEERK